MGHFPLEVLDHHACPWGIHTLCHTQWVCTVNICIHTWFCVIPSRCRTRSESVTEFINSQAHITSCTWQSIVWGDLVYSSTPNPKPQISYMEKDMDSGLANILCARVDEHAGDWPSQSFLGLFRIADDCVKPKMVQRAEVVEVQICTAPQTGTWHGTWNL